MAPYQSLGRLARSHFYYWMAGCAGVLFPAVWYPSRLEVVSLTHSKKKKKRRKEIKALFLTRLGVRVGPVVGRSLAAGNTVYR